MEARTINDELYSLYSEHWDLLASIIPKRQGYSQPHLMDANPDYAHAPRRLFIVGQQPNKWGREYGEYGERRLDDPIKELMKFYDKFNRGENYKKGDFFPVAHRLQQLLNPRCDRHGFMWANLIRIDYARNSSPKEGRVPSQVEKEVCNVPLLLEEMNIVKPDVVVFFTGPDYERRLMTTFPGIKFGDIKGYEPLVLAQLTHPQLPKHTYRTYHPKYLCLKALDTRVVNKIVEMVNSA